MKQIAITFDDGPCEYTPQVLDILEKYNAHATFFVLGNRINDTTTKYLQREIKMGCEVGNHTYSHVNINAMTKEAALADVAKGTEAIKKAIGKTPTLMRPPYGGVTKGDRKQWIDDQYIIYWKLDTLDWEYPNTERIIKEVLDNAEDGDIVLMHEIHKTTVDGVERIVKGLQEQGYELLTISELSEAKNEPLRKHRLIGSF